LDEIKKSQVLFQIIFFYNYFVFIFIFNFFFSSEKKKMVTIQPQN